MNRFADTVIIGAGILGSSAAFHLTRGARVGERARPTSARIVVVEKGAIGSGMTKRSGGLVRATFPNPVEAQLAAKSLAYFADWKNIGGGDCAFVKTGAVVIAERALPIATRAITPDELRALQPHARVDDIAFAAYEPDAGYVDPLATTQAFANRAKEWGAEFRTGTLVKSIRVERGRVIGVETTTGAIETLNVIVMAGAWSERLLKPLGVEIGLQPTRVQVAFFDRPAELKKGHCAFVDLMTGAYFRPHPFGLTYAGLLNEEINLVNPDHFDETVSQEFVADLRARVATRLPAMANARCVRGHTGVYDLTTRARPIISRAPNIAGLIVATGFGANGFALAPAIGACVAEMVTDGAASFVDIRALAL